jgi:hypothetical protein
MGIVDLSTSEEIKSSNYPNQRKLADHWNKFGERTNGSIKGEFNVFFIKAEVVLKSSENLIKVKGYKQITNYWAGPGSMLIEQKRRFNEFTSIKSIIGVRIENFTISRKTKLKAFLKLFSSKYYQLDSKYLLRTNDSNLFKTIGHIWTSSKINHYSDYDLTINYTRNSGLLKMKIHKMLGRIYELDNLLIEFRKLINELKKST